jgi:tetratricopeptide (TPR) repeat protein
VLDWYRAQVGLAMLERGERAEAEQVIRAAVAIPPIGEPGIDYILLAAWAEMGTAAAAVGLLDACRRYYDCLAPFSGGTVLTAAAVSFDGAVDHHLGVLASALGRADDAVRHFERAERVHERLGAIAWLGRTRAELAGVLADRDLPADRDRIGGLLDAARATATELGMAGLLRRIDGLAARPESVFRREGDVWRISFDGREIRLRDAKGLRDIAALLGAAGREIPAVMLAGAAEAAGADPVLDERARREYRARLAELDEVEDSAERDFLVRELAAAVGLGGRARGLGDDRERARKAVTARIQESLRRISGAHPALGEHLRGAITTGHLCCYRSPDPIWRVAR